MATLVDLLSSTYAPVQMEILPHLEVADILTLTRTCKGFHQLQPVLKVTAYNIDHQLSRFLTSPKKFRSILGACRGLIVGDFARRFFSRSKIVTNILELFLEDSNYDNTTQMIDHLVEDGYQDLEGFFQFSKQNDRSEELRINVKRWGKAAIVGVFLEARTTADVNFLSWNKAYSVFSYNTFVRKESFMLGELDNDMTGHLKTLTHEGLKTKTVSWVQRKVSSSIFHRGYNDKDTLRRRRRVGDRYSWVLDLDITDLQVPDIPDAILELSTFRLHLPWKYAQTWQVAKYVLEFDDSLRHPILQYQYVTLAEDTFDDDGMPLLDENQERHRGSHYARRCEELRDRLDELTLVELLKISPSERPSQFVQLSAGSDSLKDAVQTRYQFDLPSDWTFYDDEVIAFLKTAWAEQQLLDAKEAESKPSFIELAQQEQKEHLEEVAMLKPRGY